MGLFDPHASNRSIFGIPIPDFGISEAVGSLIGAPRTQSGGSNLFGPAQVTQGYVPPVNLTSPTSGSVLPARTTTNTGSVPQTQQQQQQSSGGGSNNQPNNIDQALNDIFNSGNSYLDQLSSNTNQEGQNAYADLANLVANQKTDLTNQQSTANTNYNNLTTQTEKSKMSAMEEAIRAYNATRQQASSRYGMGSGTGQAINDIGAQEFYRSQGNIESSNLTALGSIAAKHTELDNFMVSAFAKLQQDEASQKRSIAQQFNDKLAQISQMRFQLESQRQGAKIDAMNASLAQSRQIELIHVQSAEALNNFKASQSYQLGQATALLQNQAANPTPGIYRAPNYTVNQTGDYQAPTAYNYSAKDNTNDPFASLYS